MTATAVSRMPAASRAAVPPRTPRAVYALVVAGFAVRIAAILALQAWKHPNAFEHRSLANSLLKHGIFGFGDFGYYGPSSVQSPPYPLLLAGLFWLFGPESAGAYVTAMVLNALLGALSIWLVWRMTVTLGGTSRLGVLAAAMIAFWPGQIYTVTHVQAVIAITASVPAMVILYSEGVRTGRVWTWVGFSLVATIASLTEPVFLPAAALTGLIVLAAPTLTGRQRVRNAAILFVAAVVVFGPWVVRNYNVHGRLMPVKSTFWVNVWKGNNPNATGTDRLPLPPERRAYFAREGLLSLSDSKLRDPKTDDLRQYDLLSDAQRARLHKQPDAAREDIWKEFAQAWIRDNPAGYARLCATRLFKTLTIDWDNPKSYSLAYVAPKFLLLGLTIAGVAMAVRRGWALFYPALLVLTCLLTYTLTITAARFSIPLEPIQFALASLPAAWVLAKLTGWNAEAPE